MRHRMSKILLTKFFLFGKDCLQKKSKSTTCDLISRYRDCSPMSALVGIRSRWDALPVNPLNLGIQNLFGLCILDYSFGSCLLTKSLPFNESFCTYSQHRHSISSDPCKPVMSCFVWHLTRATGNLVGGFSNHSPVERLIRNQPTCHDSKWTQKASHFMNGLDRNYCKDSIEFEFGFTN